jgi:hypothetical protein
MQIRGVRGRDSSSSTFSSCTLEEWKFIVTHTPHTLSGGTRHSRRSLEKLNSVVDAIRMSHTVVDHAFSSHISLAQTIVSVLYGLCGDATKSS